MVSESPLAEKCVTSAHKPGLQWPINTLQWGARGTDHSFERRCWQNLFACVTLIGSKESGCLNIWPQHLGKETDGVRDTLSRGDIERSIHLPSCLSGEAKKEALFKMPLKDSERKMIGLFLETPGGAGPAGLTPWSKTCKGWSPSFLWHL